jgi:DNA gyrase inhibitor GyrI
MSKLKMPAMRYAATRVSGDIRKVSTATDYLFRGWLINSDYEPEHAPALEVFLDKENAMDWSHFELEQCIPVRKLAKTGETAGSHHRFAPVRNDIFELGHD